MGHKSRFQLTEISAQSIPGCLLVFFDFKKSVICSLYRFIFLLCVFLVAVVLRDLILFSSPLMAAVNAPTDLIRSCVAWWLPVSATVCCANALAKAFALRSFRFPPVGSGGVRVIGLVTVIFPSVGCVCVFLVFSLGIREGWNP